jgi:acetyl coenzyme A synthetase (ADP forming)-like protein
MTPTACDALLATGDIVHLRPATDRDRAELLALHEGLSPESLHLRFLSIGSESARAYVDTLVKPPTSGHLALVAVFAGRIVGVAGYERVADPDAAEIAMVVGDALHGRGIGTLLLEHLAHAARANGLRRLVATVAWENRRMLDVLACSGMRHSRTMNDGVVDVVIPLIVEEALLQAVDERERLAQVRSLERVLRPRTVAVVGASRRPGAVGRAVVHNLVTGDFAGAVYPVNRHADAVAGLPAYPSVRDVPRQVDLAVLAVPAPDVVDVVRECGERAVRGVVVLASGFADTGAPGEASQQQVVGLARAAGMRLIGPNCLGLLNTDPQVRLNATFAPTCPPPGTVAMLSQSGGLGIALLERAATLGLGVSSFVSIGNRADVSANDLLLWWEQDVHTRLVVLYLESFGNPRKFARIARRLSRTKPIVAMKGGRSSAGSRAARSHTAAAATPAAVVDALFRQAGVIAVDSLGELFDVVTVLAHTRVPAGPRVAVVGNAGGPGILAADAAATAGLQVPELSGTTQRRLRALLPPGAAVVNPVDTVAVATAEQFGAAVATTAADPAIDAVLAVLTPVPMTSVDDLRAETLREAGRTGKPVLVSTLGQSAAITVVTAAGSAVPSFAAPEEAMRALARVAAYGERQRRPVGEVPVLPDVDTPAVRQLAADFLAAHPAGGWLGPAEASTLVTRYGVRTVPSVRVASADDAVAAATTLGFPVAVKAAAADLVHKTDVGGVRLGLTDAAAVRDACERIDAALGERAGGLLVQPVVAAGVETVVGVVQDPVFGPLVMFGLGGVFTDLLDDRVFNLLPLTDLDAAEMVDAVRAAPLLHGYRGAPPVDVGALTDLLLRVARLAEDLPELAELDLNPVIVHPNGLTAVDVKARLTRAVLRDDDVRRLP